MSSQLNRRGFLKAASLAGAAATLGPLAAATPSSKRDLKKAIMYATIGTKGTVAEKLQAVKDAGFAGVEPMSHMDQDEVMKALDATGLKAASVCCSTHWSVPLSHPDELKRREALEGVFRALKDAKRYGATSILLVPGVVNKQTNYDDCFRRSVAEIKKAVPTAQELGVKIACENVWNDFITKPEQAVEFLDAIGSDQVGWHFDIGNVIRYGEPQDWIPKLGSRILKLHIKEYSKVKGFGVPLLGGDNNWQAIMKALDDVGYSGWGISEQPGDQAKNAEALSALSGQMDMVFAS